MANTANASSLKSVGGVFVSGYDFFFSIQEIERYIFKIIFITKI